MIVVAYFVSDNPNVQPSFHKETKFHPWSLVFNQVLSSSDSYHLQLNQTDIF